MAKLCSMMYQEWTKVPDKGESGPKCQTKGKVDQSARQRGKWTKMPGKREMDQYASQRGEWIKVPSGPKCRTKGGVDQSARQRGK